MIFFDYIQPHINYQIKRNCIIDGYFPDGYIEDLLLSIEFDEQFHSNLISMSHDLEKDNNLKKIGILTIRIKEHDWLYNKQKILENLLFVIESRRVILKQTKT